jgi:hypothetical protein
MNQEDMLKELGVSAAQLHDLLGKFHAFFASLDEPQRAAIRRSLPTVHEALLAFGPTVNEEDLLKLFEGDAGKDPIILCVPLHRSKNPR